MDPKRILYTRQQIGELTGIDDTTLNYWSREGVLRAASGGGGKGQHRRFPAHEVNLAAILGQLRRYGANIEAIRSMAAYFHSTIDWIEDRSLTDDDLGVLTHIQQVRETFDKYGSGEVSPKNIPAGLTFDAPINNRGCFELNWPQTEEYLRAVNAKRGISDRHFELAKETADDFELLRYTYSLITEVQEPAPKEKLETGDLTLFVRGDEGEWWITAGIPWARERSAAFVAVDVASLLWKVWNQ